MNRSGWVRTVYSTANGKFPVIRDNQNRPYPVNFRNWAKLNRLQATLPPAARLLAITDSGAILWEDQNAQTDQFWLVGPTGEIHATLDLPPTSADPTASRFSTVYARQGALYKLEITPKSLVITSRRFP